MSTGVVWLRRDLRLHDHPPLAAALAAHDAVVPLFVLDPRLRRGRFASANRTRYMLDCLAALDAGLCSRGGRLVVRTGRPEEVVPAVAAEAGADAVYAAGDASPFARARDARVAARVELRLGPGLFAGRLGALGPPRVFSPFRRAWERQPRRELLDGPATVPVPDAVDSEPLPGLEAPALEDRPEPGEAAALGRLEAWLGADGGVHRYATRRGVLADPTSRLSQDLHFGTLSPLLAERRAAALEGRGPAKWRAELAWRDFYASVLVHHPHVVRHAFRPELDDLPWRTDPAAFEAWQRGRTGFPVVDAGMRQLLACGWLHNRARMIVASFLTKDLHLDWRLGERHFMRHLIDGDVASNNGGWQWTAGTGTDPHDYTRVFSPARQQERFDPDGRYVGRWVPELATDPGAYPAPMVDHAAERRRAIEAFRGALSG